MLAHSQSVVGNPQRFEPIAAAVFPVFKPFEVCARLAEKFKLHLLEFSYAEDKVSGSNFVAEAFAYLSHAERYSFAGGAADVFEVDENP